jgi:hypothetical protein
MVNAIPPTISLSGAASVYEGQVYSVTPSVSWSSNEPDSDTVTSCMINWGDGSGATSATPGMAATHVFNTPGNYSVTANVIDDDGASGSTGLALTVNPLFVDIGTPSAVLEGNTVSFPLTLCNSSGQPTSCACDVTVYYHTVDGTAVGGSDYSAASEGRSVVIPAGSTTAAIAVATMVDSVNEPDETFAVSLDGAANASASGSATASIKNISASLESIQFTSDYRDANGNNALYHSGTYGSSGLAPQSPDWSPEFDCNSIAQARGTYVTVDVKVDVEPAGVAFKLDGQDEGYTGGSWMCFWSGPQTSTGAPMTITLTAAEALPNYVTRSQPDIYWDVTLTGSNTTKLLAETTNQVFVTLGKPNPVTSWGLTAPVTDIRLAKCIDICQGDTTAFQAALAIQQWLPTALQNNWSKTNVAGDADHIWGVLDGNGMNVLCLQSALFEQMMLTYLGANATTELILPTPALDSNGQVKLAVFGDPIPLPDSNGYQLMFNFGSDNFNSASGANNFEAGVKVTDDSGAVQFYTEGSNTQSQAIVVGVASPGVTAEYSALKQLGNAFGATLQEWAHFGWDPVNQKWINGQWQANQGVLDVPVP